MAVVRPGAATLSEIELLPNVPEMLVPLKPTVAWMKSEPRFEAIAVVSPPAAPTTLTLFPFWLRVMLLPPARIRVPELIGARTPAVFPPSETPSCMVYACPEFQSLGRTTEVAVPSATAFV
jgi:hypothetical protein